MVTGVTSWLMLQLQGAVADASVQNCSFRCHKKHDDTLKYGNVPEKNLHSASTRLQVQFQDPVYPGKTKSLLQMKLSLPLEFSPHQNINILKPEGMPVSMRG